MNPDQPEPVTAPRVETTRKVTIKGGRTTAGTLRGLLHSMPDSAVVEFGDAGTRRYLDSVTIQAIDR